MKYRHKMKLQEAAKVKGQKRRVADCSERPQYTDEEVAKLVDYDYGCLLDMIYYKLESMRDFFLSKHTHGADAKKYAKQMEVAMRLISIAQGKDAFFDDDEDAPYVNTKNYKRYEKQFYSCYWLRKEKAWHVLFVYLERRQMRGGLEGKKYHFIGLVKLRIFADRNTEFNNMK